MRTQKYGNYQFQENYENVTRKSYYSAVLRVLRRYPLFVVVTGHSPATNIAHPCGHAALNNE